jgi:chaperonin GroES
LSIQSLIDSIGSLNLADDMDDDDLVEIGSRVKRQYDEDLSSMTDWTSSVQHGIALMKQEYQSKSFPWPGASNYKDPILTEAATTFGDKATLELLRNKDLVGTAVIGRDPEGKKKDIAERISEAMNYQVNYDMDGWRDDQERLLYTLPTVGAVFKKVVFDSLEKKCESVLINYPDFVVNQATKSMDKCRSFSHILDITEDEIRVRVNCGKWLDPLPEQTDHSPGDAGSNESEKVIDSIDNPRKWIEQHTYFDLDDDGHEEPYIITFEHSSSKVVRIIPRYDEQSIIVEYDDRYMSVSDVIRIEQEKINKEFGIEAAALMGLDIPPPDLSEYKLIKVVPFVNLVKYGFIKAPDGTFLDLGYSHLLGALTQNINTTTNQINDRTTLNILGGGFLAKEFRIKQGTMSFRMGEYKQTDVAADKLAKGIFPQPLQEPSQTAFQMLSSMQERAGGFVSTVDISGKLQANTAPTTALAIIQEAIIPTTALFRRVLNAASKEFQILFRINQRTFPKYKYTMILADDAADPMSDFNTEMLDVVPTANAEMSSKMHRIQTAQLELEQLPNVIQTGGNGAYILKNYFEAIGSDIDQIYPEEGSMSPEDQKMQQQLLQAQEQQNAIMKQQADILEREQARLDTETQMKVKGMEGDQMKLLAEVREIDAKTQKITEEAQTESMKNAGADALMGVEKEASSFNRAVDMAKMEREMEMRERELSVEREKKVKEIGLLDEKIESERANRELARDKFEFEKNKKPLPEHPQVF